MNIRAVHILALVSISVILSGCVGFPVNPNVELGPTMAESYHAAISGQTDQSLTAVRRQLPVASVSVAKQSVEPHVNQDFPTLPNHNVVVYIYPHLAGADQMPVQGYYTAVPFYKEIHYAIPGEEGAA